MPDHLSNKWLAGVIDLNQASAHLAFLIPKSNLTFHAHIVAAFQVDSLISILESFLANS